MKSLFLFLFLLSFGIFAYKPLPPGAGVSVKPNVLFVIDTSGSMAGCENSPCCSTSWCHARNLDTRIESTRAALTLLMDDINISSSIRSGLTRFPNKNPRNMLVVPIDDSTNIVPDGHNKAQVEVMKTEISALPAGGGTPLTDAINKARKYFLGTAGTDVCKSTAYGYYGSTACKTPIINKCQKNYIILFTDGEPNGSKRNVSNAAYASYNHGLAGATDINGNALVDTHLPVYAIAFGSDTNVDYIASGTSNTGTVYNPEGGGTDHGYTASNTTELKNAFDKIISDIGAKNITATSPTLIPGFAGPENDVVYLTNFKPREHKQWSGHLYKYKIKSSGTGILDGSPQWDLNSTLSSKNIDSRRVLTVCKDMNNNTIKDDVDTGMAKFNLNNAKKIAFCMLQGATGGAGNPLIAGIKQTFPWGNSSLTCTGNNWEVHYDNANAIDGCMPTREWIDPVCQSSENIVDMIEDQYSTYQNICYFADFEDYALGQSLPSGAAIDCSPNTTTYGSYVITKRDKARAIQRYLCQHNNAYCGCFERWEGSISGQPSNGKAKYCTTDNNCGDTNVIVNGKRDETKRSCYNNFCVGPPIDYTNNSIWKKQDMRNYKNDITSTMSIPSTNSGVGSIRLKLKDLNFNSQNNTLLGTTGPIRDYLVIDEYRDGPGPAHVKHVITTRKDSSGNDKRVIYSCFDGESVDNIGGNGLKINSDCVIKNERPIPQEVTLKFPLLDSSQKSDGKSYSTKKIKLTFHSNNRHNDLAFILESYQLKPKDITNYRWAFSGDENEKIGNRDAFKKEDIKLTGRLIDFFRGKDSFQEDTSVKCKYKDDGTRNGACPDRLYPLADIYNSRVKFIGTPSQMYTYPGYRAYQADPNNIKTIAESILLFGANDGLLHAVNPDDTSGEEIWAFVPPTLLARLKDIVESNHYDKTVSQFFADASVKVMDVCKGTDCANSKTDWKRIMVMGFGEAQEAIMAMDITDLDNPKFKWAVLNETPRIFKSPLFNDPSNPFPNCKKFKRVLVWDKNGNIQAYSNLASTMSNNSELVHDRSDHIKKTDRRLSDYPEYDYSLLDRTWSEPVIAQLGGTNSSTGKFVAVIGGGGNFPKKGINPKEDATNDCVDVNRVYGNSVYMIDIDNGKILTRYDLPPNSNNIPQKVPATVAILPKPQSVDVSGIQNRIMAQIYTADMSGRVWRMTINDDDISAKGKVVNCKDVNNTVSSVNYATKEECLKLYDNSSTQADKNYIFKSVAITYDGKTSNVGNSDPNKDTSVWVYGGTGNVSLDGLKDNSGKNILFAVKDSNWELSSTAGKSTGGVTINKSSTNFREVKVSDIANEATNGCSKDAYSDKSGWYYKLPDNYKLIGKPVIVDGYVFFTVYEHGIDNGGECSGHLGTSWLYSFKLFSACHNSAFDKMGDGVTANSDANKFRAKLGKGVATAPVLRGNTMYFGISGEANANDGAPILGQGQRDANIIRWDRPNGDDAESNKSSNVPFAYFNEVY